MPGFATVHEAFFFAAAHHGDAPFVQVLPEMAAAYGIAAGELRYREAADRVEALVDRYRRAGYGHGHRAGLLLENRPAFFLHWFALNALGVSVVPINADLRAAELDYLVGHSEICVAIALPGRHADLAAAAARVGRPLNVVGPDDAGALPRALFAPPLSGGPGLHTECGLLYTSGTTGRPKGCVLTNDYYLLSGERYVTLGGACAVREGDRLITPLPLTHMNAMACSTLAMILVGGCVIQLDRFHPKTWWDSVRASRASIVHYLGVMPAMLSSDPPSPDDRRHAVRFGFGAGVDRRLHAPFEERFGFPLVEAWAMTETGNGAVIIANHEPRHVGTNCFGLPREWVEVRLLDDAGLPLPAHAHDVPGELLVRAAGPDPRRGFFREYLKDAEATAQAWEGGWFHTGDMVRAGPDGQLHFVDRKKNVIRRSGENIAAVEVESVLRRHPAVREVAVAATPDPVRGDEVLACVVSHDAVPPDARAELAASIVALSLEQLAYYKAPGYVAFVDRLPLTATQKIQRGELKAIAATLPADACCVDTRHLKKRGA
jgi:acyl-CoA synthetase (AMP-forming)/AMP-acid ligase II